MSVLKQQKDMLFLWHLGEKNFFLIHLVLRALTRNVFRDLASLFHWCGSHLVVGDITGTAPPSPPNVHSPLTVSFLLRFLCLSDQSVSASWQFLVIFKLRIPLGLAPSRGFEPGSQENCEGPWPSLAWVSSP